MKELLERHEKELLEDWMREQKLALTRRADLISEADLQKESREFLTHFRKAVLAGTDDNITTTAWAETRASLEAVSRSRALAGFTPSETATFVFSLKSPAFNLLRTKVNLTGTPLADESWKLGILLDKLGLYTTEVFQKSREEIIKRQQQEMLELSTPVVKLWDGILAVPLIGTLDSARTQVVMESLLETIVATGSSIAIVDITGVPTVDTLVAQHLLKTVAAAKLMGAQCIISGIRPQIAQTMVHLGVAFGDVATKASLADALSHAFRQIGCTVTKQASRA